MINAPAEPAALSFADQLFAGLHIDAPATGVPAAVAELDDTARALALDARAALADFRYGDAAAAIDKLAVAQREIRDIFDTTVASAPLIPILQASSRLAQIVAALRAALVAERGF